MVEGLDARSLFMADRINSLAGPGVLLVALGMFIPASVDAFHKITGQFTLLEIFALNTVLSGVMMLGFILVAFGVTYRRRGEVFVPLALSTSLLLSVDLFAWIYFSVIHFIPEPSGFFILPYTNPGELPLLLTAFFILMVLAAKYSYMRDPRNSGKPLYFR